MGYFLGLIFVLTGLWLGMSGYYKQPILSLGAASILLSALLSVRFGLLDREGSPYGRIIPLVTYWFWLVIEIFKANIPVIRAALKAELDINPALVKVRTSCESDLARTVFANSITLTPGTVSVAVEGDKILVHALYEENATPESFQEMDRRSRLASDGRPAT